MTRTLLCGGLMVLSGIAGTASAQDGASAPSCPASCAPTSVSTLDRPVTALTVAGDSIYWIVWASALAGVYRTPLGGGESVWLAPVRTLQDDAYSWDLAVAAGVVFALDTGDAGISPGAGPILRIDAPGSYRVLATGGAYPCRTGGHPLRLAIDSTHVYWTEDAGRFDPGSGGGTEPTCVSPEPFRFIRSVPQAGGAARTLGRVTSRNVVVDEEFIYFTRGAALLRLPKTAPPGAEPSPLASGLALGEAELALAGRTLYVGGAGGRIYAVNLDTGAVRNIVGASEPDARVIDFAFDDRHVYWIHAGSAAGIYRAPRDGGLVELRVAGSASSLAVAGKYLYWGVDNAVLRQCK